MDHNSPLALMRISKGDFMFRLIVKEVTWRS
jgi:hypothetical protein